MKNPIPLVILGLGLLTINALAQGQIFFSNNPLIPVVDGRTLEPAGSDVTVGLYYTADLTATADQLELGGTTPVIIAGIFNNGGLPLTLPLPPGTPVLVEIRGWFGGFASYEEALAFGSLGVGRSGLLNVMNLGGGSPPLPPPSPAIQGGLESFIVGIPEPSTWALGLLGAGWIGLKQWRRWLRAPRSQNKQAPGS